MTFRQYYIEQFRDFAFCFRHAKKPRHWLLITGKLKPDARYMGKDNNKEK